MNVVGLITEYNPFHNGHRLHLENAVEMTRAEAVVVVMSGNFLQRGEPTLFNKWSRSGMALAGGADVVLELPAAFATRSARQFATGAVRILNDSGVVSHLCFGSESGEVEPLQRLADLFRHEPPEFKKLIKKHLQSGVTLPVAGSRALAEYMTFSRTSLQPSDRELLNRPNNILGIEYLRALADINSVVKPVTMARVAAGYHDTHFSSNGIASATGIRKALEKSGGLTDEVNEVVPMDTMLFMQEERALGRGPVFPERLMPLLLYRLRTATKEQLAATLDISEGLENRITRAARNPGTYTEFVAAIKTKRYTRTRIQRALLYIMLGFNKEMANNFDVSGPGYIRILGVSSKGRELIRHMKKRAALPVVTRVLPFMETPGHARDMLSFDILATDLYTLLYPNSHLYAAGQDYKVMPVMLK